MKTFLLAQICVLSALYGTAQSITGTVTDELGEPLPGAYVYWTDQMNGTTASDSGTFTLQLPDEFPAKLAASFVGFRPDTATVTSPGGVHFQLRSAGELDEFEVITRKRGITLPDDEVIKTEQITEAELTKAACCDLAGCFETQTTVQPQTTDVLTDAKELRIAGLSGVYNQILIDGEPVIRGLSYTYGISGFPGTIVENIYVSKGAGSVLQGFESISGQINVVTKNPEDTDTLLLNAYINNFNERHLNANVAIGGEKVSNLLTFHTVQPADVTDRQGDDLMDLPRLTRYMLNNRFHYGSQTELGFFSEVSTRFLSEERIGGQTSFDPDRDLGGTRAFGQTVSMMQPEIRTKTGYRFDEKHRTVFSASSFYQDRDAYFGTTRYRAEQVNIHAKLQHEYSYGAANDLKAGASFRYMDLTEEINFTQNLLDRTMDGSYGRYEIIPGLFAENTLSLFDNAVIWAAGVRADHHSQFGTQFTPRTFVKWDATPTTSIRANAGTGWRTANVFSENIGLLASSRDVLITEELQPEKAVNTGVNITQKIEIGSIEGSISADYYRTRFFNQIFPDYDRDPRAAYVYNFTGKSMSNTFQSELSLLFYERIELRTGYVFLDVYREIEGQKELLPFNPRHRLMGALSYRPLSDRFYVDMNVHWYGRKRLPDTRNNPEEFQRPDFSDPYALFNMQLTYNVHRFEIYAGSENLFNFKQEMPVLGWQDPFGEYFDTSFIWGPVRGREVYAGVRYRL